MRFDENTVALANDLRRQVQESTKTIDDGESVMLLAWYTFVLDHARAMGREPKALAESQLAAFLEEMAPKLKLRLDPKAGHA